MTELVAASRALLHALRAPVLRIPLVAACLLTLALFGLALTATGPGTTTHNTDDWPDCQLYTELAGETLRAQGHTIKWDPLPGMNHGMVWLDGVYVGKSASPKATFMACANRKLLAPLAKIDKY